MDKLVTLCVGEDLHLKKGKDRVMYAGMPSESVFSVVQRKLQIRPLGYMGQAWNLFYPAGQQDIAIGGVKILVESVTPEQIRFRVQ